MRWRPGDTRETCEYKSTDLGVGTLTHTNTRVQIWLPTRHLIFTISYMCTEIPIRHSLFALTSWPSHHAHPWHLQSRAYFIFPTPVLSHTSFIDSSATHTIKISNSLSLSLCIDLCLWWSSSLELLMTDHHRRRCIPPLLPPSTTSPNKLWEVSSFLYLFLLYTFIHFLCFIFQYPKTNNNKTNVFPSLSYGTLFFERWTSLFPFGC